MNSTTIELFSEQEQRIQDDVDHSQTELVRELMDAELCAVGGGAGDVVLG